MQIPESIEVDVLSALRRDGDATSIREFQVASRGGVSETLRFRTEAQDYFLKWNNKPGFGTFTNEALQLSLLRQSRTIHVPVVVGFAEGAGEQPAWMLQVWAGSATRGDKEQRLGRILGEQVAQLHIATADAAPGYGYVEREVDGVVRLPTQDWVGFFYDGHMRHNIERARRENRWTQERNRRVDMLIERLPDLLGGVKRAPTLLHGDLHSGNVRLGPSGESILVDPWLFYGDRELEIVSTYLSGDFPDSFYDAYNATFPLEADFEERVDLYKLVWFLSGLYYSPNPGSGEDNSIADPILARYVG